MNKHRGTVLCQIHNAGFHQRSRLAGDCPRCALRLLVDHPFDGFDGIRCRVLECAIKNALLADRELEEHCWIGSSWLSVLRDGKDAKWHPIFRDRLGIWNAERNCLGLVNVLLLRAHGLIAVVHRAIVVVNIFAVVVVDRISPAIIDPVRESRPRGTCPETESWIVRIVDVIVVPPTVAVPIIKISPIVLPIVANVAQILLAPILPLAPVSNSARKILYVVTTRTSGSTDVARAITGLTGSTNVSRAIARLPGSANICWAIAGLTGSSDICRAIAGLTGSADIGGPITRLSWSANVGRSITRLTRTSSIGSSAAETIAAADPAGIRGQRARNIAESRLAGSSRKRIARTIAQKLCSRAAGQCATDAGRPVAKAA